MNVAIQFELGDKLNLYYWELWIESYSKFHYNLYNQLIWAIDEEVYNQLENQLGEGLKNDYS